MIDAAQAPRDSQQLDFSPSSFGTAKRWCVVFLSCVIATSALAPVGLAQSLIPEEPPPVKRDDTASIPRFEPTEDYWRRNLLWRVADGQKYAVTHWWKSEFLDKDFLLPFAGSMALAATSLQGASNIDRTIVDGVVDPTDRIAKGFTRLGDADTGVFLLGVGWVVGRISGNERWRETISLSTESMLNAVIWSSAIKAVTSRTRPSYGAAGGFFQFGAPSPYEPTSFPSGHAMGAFAVATVVAGQYPEKRWVRWVMYSTATLISASRVRLGRHFVSDVLIGGLLGNSMGRMVLHRAGRGREERESTPGIWQPYVDPYTGGTGVTYTKRW